jgi:hypothetical protein
MAWRIDKQANGRFAIFSSRIHDYIVIDADEAEIERIYKEKGIKVYLASARAQMTTRVTSVRAEGEAQIASHSPFIIRLSRRSRSESKPDNADDHH